MGSHNVQCAQTLSPAGTYWPEDGLEKTETCSYADGCVPLCFDTIKPFYSVDSAACWECSEHMNSYKRLKKEFGPRS
jgi:hypothetical protein